jgi:conjugal transfer ATP-binding protein TraC
LATQLYPFSKKGAYGKFFNGEADLSFKEKLIVIEFEELRQKKNLRNVVLQMVILQITNQMILGERQRKPFSIVIDEAWDMLKGGKSGEFIETLARTLRKFNGSLVVGTQSINDFYVSPGAQAAFDNSDWMCLLSQKKESIEKLKETNNLVMDEHMEKMLKSVHTKQGEYAEIMIYGPAGYAIGRLLLDPFSQMLYSTKAEDYRGVIELKKLGLSTKEAINRMIGVGTNVDTGPGIDTNPITTTPNPDIDISRREKEEAL